MQIVKIIVSMLVIALLINWVRGSEGNWPLPQAFPFLSGDQPSRLWDGAGVVMLLIVLWGWARLARRGE